MSDAALAIEFVALFFGVPALFFLLPYKLPPLPVLWLATLYCYLVLRRDPTFAREQLWQFSAAPSHLVFILLLFSVVAVIFALAVRRLAPHLLFLLPRTRPRLWLAILVLYPVLSVYPQGIVYRAFLMHRYHRWFTALPMPPAMQGLALVLLSATCFAYMHVIFRNALAVGLTFAGGLLFAWRYQATGSLALSSLEHALYGCMLFTVGLGQFIYLGRSRPAQQRTPAAETAGTI